MSYERDEYMRAQEAHIDMISQRTRYPARPARRDPRNPEMTPDEKAAYDTWWGGLCLQGDPMHRPWLLREAFHAAWTAALSKSEGK